MVVTVSSGPDAEPCMTQIDPWTGIVYQENPNEETETVTLLATVRKVPVPHEQGIDLVLLYNRGEVCILTQLLLPLF